MEKNKTLYSTHFETNDSLQAKYQWWSLEIWSQSFDTFFRVSGFIILGLVSVSTATGLNLKPIIDIECTLTFWEPKYDTFVPGNRPKTSSCQLPYNHHSSSVDCTIELFKHPKRIGQYSSLHSEKKFLVVGCGFFVNDVISEVVFGPFWLMLPGLGSNL